LYNRPDGACQSLEWKIQGSDNGIDWTDIDHVVLESAEYGSVYAREIAENAKFFRMHRFYSIRANDNYTTVEFFTARGKYAADSTDDAAYQVSGAGTADANGYYWDSGTVTDGGYPVFTNGLCKFYQTDAANCCIASIADSREYYNVQIPECTVSVYNGDYPAPEVRIL
jgi:hypothetical protein